MPSEHDRVRDRYSVALSTLVEQVRQDRSVLAVLLGGSLSYDRVWEKSDIDLVLITIDDRKVGVDSLCLDADGVNVHAMLMPRTEFRKAVEGSLRNSFMHAFLARARLIYSDDPSIAALCATLADLGQRDQEVQLLRAGISALPAIYKAHKWLITRADLDYTALWILYAATSLAQMEVIGAGQLADREVIPQALALNPAFFRLVYTDLLNAPKTRNGVEDALRAVDDYVASRAPRLFAAVIDHLREVREARSCRELEDHFTRHFGINGVTTACEYLADQRLIGRAAVATRLTRRSSAEVQEMAFYALDPR